MKVLSICSALNNSYLGLDINGKVITKIIKSDENYHSLYLVSAIKKMAESNDFNLSDLDFITVNLGPGSFTGIRVALTVAKVMAGELNLDIVGLRTNEILLEAYKKEYLIMDARRDMYYFADKNNIELVKKDIILQKISNIDKSDILCDKRSAELIEGTTCFEDKDIDLASTMLELSKNRYQNTADKSEFNYLKISANYIQTPPVFA